MKSPRANERETRAEKFMTDCLEAGKRCFCSEVRIRAKRFVTVLPVSLSVYRNKECVFGGSPVAPNNGAMGERP